MSNHSNQNSINAEPLSDTRHGMTLDEYIEKILSLGFEEVLKTDFKHTTNDRREREDTYYVFAHRDGWLITLDTYTHDYGFDKGVDQGFSEKAVNVIQLHYNWKPGSMHRRVHHTHNGGFVRYDENAGIYIWAGYHDVREGLDYSMQDLVMYGDIMNPWEKNTINWLAAQHSVEDQKHMVAGEWDRWLSDITKISHENFAKLPDWVKTMIGDLSN